MEKASLILLVIIVLELGWWCEGCLKEESIALLRIKNSFYFPTNDTTTATSNASLSNWSRTADCCSWHEIHCDKTGRVAKIFLDSVNWDSASDRPISPHFYLNASLFLPFQNLNTLSLERNGIVGCLKNEGFEKLSGLANLKVLDLCFNAFDVSILASLAGLSSIKSLDMSNNNLSGTLPSCLANMTSLQYLDLRYNRFSGNISASPLKSLSSIRSLYLSNNSFKIPISLLPFYNHSNLKYLDAGNNQFMVQSESHLDDDFSPKFQLNVLSLPGKESDYGPFPKFLYHQVDLTDVDFSNLKFNGGFPNWLLENNTRLTSLYLPNASLSGPFLLPNQSHTNISYLDVSRNCFDGLIPTQIGGKLPNLNQLDMSRSGFTGTIPPSLGDMNSLGYLDLSHNALSGGIPPSLGDMNSLGYLDLSHNVLSGGIPEHLATGCYRLYYLALSNNRLEGQIFSEKFNLTNLYSLQLDHNRFSGSVPEILFNLSEFRILDLSNNLLSGNLSPTSFSRASDLEEVYLSRNKLEGSLGHAFYGCRNLSILDLSHNGLTGTIPKWYDRFSSLNFLLLSHNNLKGKIPLQLCNLDALNLIDLSENKLSGQVPPCFKAIGSFRTAASYPNIVRAPPPPTASDPNSYPYHGTIEFTTKGNSYPYPYHGTIKFTTKGNSYPYPYHGTIEFTTKGNSYPYHGTILSYISGIDLSSNNLTGEIPDSIGCLKMIHVLNLSRNNLIGPIPISFSNLTAIESLDLSHNRLNGKIPPALVGLTSLAVFNVAHNNLSGKLPNTVSQFATFNASSYEENPFLCGPPLPKSCSDEIASPSPTSAANREDDDDWGIDMDAFYVTFSVAYIMVLVGIAAVLYINPHWRRVWFYFIEVRIANCYYFLVNR